VCVYTYKDTFVCVYIHIYIDTRLCVCLCVCVFVCVCVCLRVKIVYVHPHTYHHTLGVFSLAGNAHAPHAAAHGGTDFDNQILAHIAGSIGKQQQQWAKVLVPVVLSQVSEET
jgi:hypothetical protein